MSTNPVKPTPHKILDIIKETETEWTFRLENTLPIRDGQFMQLSIPRVGEAPISVSGYDEGSCDFTIRNVGKVTNELFQLKKAIRSLCGELTDMAGLSNNSKKRTC